MTNFTPDEVNILRYSYPVFIRLLESRESATLDRMYSDFKNNRGDFTAIIAEYALIREMKREIINAVDPDEPEEVNKTIGGN